MFDGSLCKGFRRPLFFTYRRIIPRREEYQNAIRKERAFAIAQLVRATSRTFDFDSIKAIAHIEYRTRRIIKKAMGIEKARPNNMNTRDNAYLLSGNQY